MAWKKDENGDEHWVPTLFEQWEDDTLTNIRIIELIMTEIISLRGRDGLKSYEDANELDEILREKFNVDTSDLERAFNFYRSQIGWYTILKVDPHTTVAKVQDQELKPEQDENKNDNHITVHDEDTDIADNPLADDWMANVMNEVMKFNHDHGRDDDHPNDHKNE